MNTFNIRQWITPRSTNGQESMEERKRSIYKEPHIHLHNILKIRKGERNRQGQAPIAIDVKGGEKELKQERKIRSMKIRGSMLT
jgi:hypothetical protein